jgi:hypothetical protein
MAGPLNVMAGLVPAIYPTPLAVGWSQAPP